MNTCSVCGEITEDLVDVVDLTSIMTIDEITINLLQLCAGCWVVSGPMVIQAIPIRYLQRHLIG